MLAIITFDCHLLSLLKHVLVSMAILAVVIGLLMIASRVARAEQPRAAGSVEARFRPSREDTATAVRWPSAARHGCRSVGKDNQRTDRTLGPRLPGPNPSPARWQGTRNHS
jgi:hypothetical protein